MATRAAIDRDFDRIPARVIEVKAVVRPHPIHRARLVSYLRLGGYRIGLLVNFHVEHLSEGIRRVLHDW